MHAAFEPFGVEGRCILHGLAHADACRAIGGRNSEFAGLSLRTIRQGALVALVSEPANLGMWGGFFRHKIKLAEVAPVLSALSSVVPFLPVCPGTVFETEEQVESLLAARGEELLALVDENAEFLECVVSADYSDEIAAEDLDALAGLDMSKPRNEVELALVSQAFAQARAGRKAEFFARLRRCLAEEALDMLPAQRAKHRPGFMRRILIARQQRRRFRERMAQISADIGAAGLLKLSPFLPPVSFRKVEVKTPEDKAVAAARTALGLEESVERVHIRRAFHRALQRHYPVAVPERRVDPLGDLQAHYALLDLVAEGQIRANKAEKTVRFDGAALKSTWLLRVHQHVAEDKVA